ncbi:ATP-binding protein [Actinokineospora enzanensis]|uniref:ATP-binding protein n=1 Tax=Actinokineospora enzanensis TaxID=155975 RepID=UPI00039C8659|nr:ATP-binding protein [Actinokineospora enzanensis]
MTTRGTHTQAVELGMQRAFALMSLVFVGITAVQLVPKTDVYAPAVLVTSGVFLLFLVVLVVRSWTARLSPLDGIAGTVVAVGCQLAHLVPAESVAPAATRANLSTVGVILVAGFNQGFGRVLLLAAVLASTFVVNVRIDGWGAGPQDMWIVLGSAFAVYFLAPYLREAGGRADLARGRLHRDRVRAAEDEARRTAHRQFRRVLHDDIAAALRAVATPDIDQGRVRAEAARAIEHAETMPEPPTGEPVELWPAVLAHTDGTGVRVRHIQLDRVLVPPDVAESIGLAVRELLSNTARHARVAEADVELRARDGGFVLRVKDKGIGFRPALVRRSARGLRDSVVARVVEAGGSAVIESRPGRGTTVLLSWAPAAAAGPSRWETRRDRALRAAVADIRVPVRSVCLPLLASLFIPAVHNLGASPAMPWLLSWLGLLVLGTIALTELAREPVNAVVGWVTAGVLAGSAVGTQLALPADSLYTYVSWPIGAISPVLALLAAIRPWWESAAALAVAEISLGTLVLTGHFTVTHVVDAVPAAVSPAIGVVMGLGISVTIARYGAIVLRLDERRAALAGRVAARASRQATHTARLAEIGREILPFLREVARARAAGAGQRDRARELEHIARDEMHIPGVLDDTARAALSRARRSGCLITTQADLDTIEPPPVVGAVLTTALSTPDAPAQVVLTVSARDETDLVSLVCVPGDPVRAAALAAAFPAHAELSDDPDATLLDLVVQRDG